MASQVTRFVVCDLWIHEFLMFGMLLTENIEGHAGNMVLVYVKYFFFCLWTV